ncbi:hypothetical protein CRG98_033541 [Punica granatum]|uniref:Uncharacterized protein n=1 Tax=Punica granatum TaxID=22663 RepID=A0A2I0IRM0_PUNGR|nr:hypothetical protein CRG98_033541 [Punica granatum]
MELIKLRRGCSRCYGASDWRFAGAALGCVQERSRPRVSGMGRESGEEGDIRTRIRPDSGWDPTSKPEPTRDHSRSSTSAFNDHMDGLNCAIST